MSPYGYACDVIASQSALGEGTQHVCQALCENDATCQYYTYHTNSAGDCFLHTECNSVTPDPDAKVHTKPGAPNPVTASAPWTCMSDWPFGDNVSVPGGPNKIDQRNAQDNSATLSQPECQKWCEDTTGCRAFGLWPHHLQDETHENGLDHKGLCRLYKSVTDGPALTSQGDVSFYISNTPTPAYLCFDADSAATLQAFDEAPVEEGLTCTGVIGNVLTTQAPRARCQERCELNGSCDYYTFVDIGVKDDNNICRLHTHADCAAGLEGMNLNQDQQDKFNGMAVFMRPDVGPPVTMKPAWDQVFDDGIQCEGTGADTSFDNDPSADTRGECQAQCESDDTCVAFTFFDGNGFDATLLETRCTLHPSCDGTEVQPNDSVRGPATTYIKPGVGEDVFDPSAAAANQV
jgi:hypothetical protein